MSAVALSPLVPCLLKCSPPSVWKRLHGPRHKPGRSGEGPSPSRAVACSPCVLWVGWGWWRDAEGGEVEKGPRLLACAPSPSYQPYGHTWETALPGSRGPSDCITSIPSPEKLLSTLSLSTHQPLPLLNARPSVPFDKAPPSP